MYVYIYIYIYIYRYTHIIHNTTTSLICDRLMVAMAASFVPPRSAKTGRKMPSHLIICYVICNCYMVYMFIVVAILRYIIFIILISL